MPKKKEVVMIPDLGMAPPNDYSVVDRSRDFKALFLGTDLGRRVLYEILYWCKPLRTDRPSNHDIPDRSIWMDIGARDIGAKLLHVLHSIPKEQPKRQTRKKKGDL